MISCPTVTKGVIRWHYDLSTLFYRLLWGPHIHHGLWDADETPQQAQLQLTETLADLAGIEQGATLYDIGCGMGGSAIHLAKTRECLVTGVTVSPFQRRWATTAARWQRVATRTNFLCADAETVALPEAGADVVWSVECTEHLFDKPAFFQQAAQWIKPGGRVAICAWLEGTAPLDDEQRQAVYDVCEGFFCPSLGSMQDYQKWMTEAGLQIVESQDWTTRVLRTWEICDDRVRRSGVRWLARLIDRDTVMFLDRFRLLLDAYRTNAMQYGCLVAQKPNDPVGS